MQRHLHKSKKTAYLYLSVETFDCNISGDNLYRNKLSAMLKLLYAGYGIHEVKSLPIA